MLRLLHTVLFCLPVFWAIGQSTGDYQSAASGTWSTAGNWQRYNGSAWVTATAAPSSADGVITILSGHTMQITATVSIDQVTINSGGTVNWSAGTLTIANGTGVDLQVDGTMMDNRGATTPSITFSTSATWQMGANGTIIRTSGNSSNNWQSNYQGGISTIPSTAFWILRKTGTQNPSISTTTPASGSVYPNLIIENNVAGTWTTGAASSFTGSTIFATVKGYLDIGGTGTSTVNFSNQNTNASPTLVNGNVLVRSGNTLSNNGTGLEIQGDLTVNGTISYDAADGRKLVFSGTNAQSISGTGTLGIYDMTINKSSNSLTLSRAITIDNLLTFTSGILYSTSTNLPTINTTASVTGASNTSFVSGPIRYIGTSAFTFPVGKGSDYQALGISAASGAGAFWTEDFNNGCTQLCLASAYSGTNGAWTMTNSGPSTACSAATTPNEWYVSCAENGNAVGACGTGCGSNATLHVGNTSSTPSAGIFCPTGDCGAAYDAGGYCGLLSMSPSTITDKRMESPTINCSAYSNISVSFKYIEGGETTNDNATLWYFDGSTWTQLADMGKTATGSCGTQGQWTSYSVTLPASANGNANVKIGFSWVNDDNGNGTDPSFAVDDISLAQIITSDFTCEYFYSNPQVPYGSTLAPGLGSLSSCEYWILDRNAGTESKYVTLSVDANSCPVGTMTDQRVARYDGISTWQNEGNSATTGSLTSGTVTSNLVTSFSPFTLASITPIVLPVELIYFDVVGKDEKALLTWKTLSEINNEKFVVEKSFDGINFIAIGEVMGRGTTTTTFIYNFVDENPYNGVNYYRLKQVDFDGYSSFTNIKTLSINVQNPIVIYPNPSDGSQLLVHGAHTINNIVIYDMAGKQINSSLLYTKQSESTLLVQLSPVLSPGIYMVEITNAQIVTTHKLVVKH